MCILPLQVQLGALKSGKHITSRANAVSLVQQLAHYSIACELNGPDNKLGSTQPCSSSSSQL